MQALLDLIVSEPPTFDNFVVGRNASALDAVRQRVEHSEVTKGLADSIYLWGEAGSGCSHLLLSASMASTARYWTASHFPEGEIENTSLFFCLDDLDALSSDQNQRLFYFLRRVEENAGCLILSGKHPPRQLPLLPELTSRISKMSVFQLLPLSDEEKIAALQYHAIRRQFLVEPSILYYFLNHSIRSMRALTTVVTAFDEYCLQNKCPPTLPAARRMLAGYEQNSPLANK